MNIIEVDLEKNARMRKAIANDLRKQLKKSGNNERYYQDLVNDYLSLWDVKNDLVLDIQDRGVTIFWDNGGGQTGYKKNDSIAELTKVNAQMLKLLSELGLKANLKKENGGDDFGI